MKIKVEENNIEYLHYAAVALSSKSFVSISIHDDISVILQPC